MRVSAGLPTGMEGLTYPIPFSDPENVIRIAQAAEKFGYDSVWGNDHMTTQNYVRAEFPVPPRFWEPLITYAFVLSETTTIKVGTGILVLPMRHDIVVTAKQIATLDHFGKGRLELGIGIGAYREEFKALQPDAKLDRGDIVDEGLQALNLLFKERVCSFDGRFRKSQMNKHLVSLSKSTLKGQGAATHEEINLIGTPAEVIDKALAFKEAGVTHLLGLYFAANSVPELLDQMQLFAEEVMPKVK